MDKDPSKKMIPSGRVFEDVVLGFYCAACGSSEEAPRSLPPSHCACCSKPYRKPSTGPRRWFKHTTDGAYGPALYGPFRTRAGAENATDDNVRD